MQKATFASVTEACYSAEKTYRLILSKYLTLLRQAHTKDIVSTHDRHGVVIEVDCILLSPADGLYKAYCGALAESVCLPYEYN